MGRSVSRVADFHGQNIYSASVNSQHLLGVFWDKHRMSCNVRLLSRLEFLINMGYIYFPCILSPRCPHAPRYAGTVNHF